MDERYILINDIDETEARLMFAWINGLPENANATIEILSHGGLCFAGTGIAQKIIEAQSRGIVFTAKVYGIVASAASDIALACNRIAMAMGAQLMIHSAWNEFLDPNDPGIQRANEAQLELIHRKLPNYTAEDLKQDRWLNAEEAVKLGVCDEYINMTDVMATFRKVAAKYNSIGGLDMKKTEKLNAEVEAVKAEAPCTENEEKKDEEMKAMDDDAMTIDVLEQMAQRLEKIEERLAVLEGKKAMVLKMETKLPLDSISFMLVFLAEKRMRSLSLPPQAKYRNKRKWKPRSSVPRRLTLRASCNSSL